MRFAASDGLFLGWSLQDLLHVENQGTVVGFDSWPDLLLQMIYRNQMIYKNLDGSKKFFPERQRVNWVKLGVPKKAKCLK